MVFTKIKGELNFIIYRIFKKCKNGSIVCMHGKFWKVYDVGGDYYLLGYADKEGVASVVARSPFNNSYDPNYEGSIMCDFLRDLERDILRDKGSEGLKLHLITKAESDKIPERERIAYHDGKPVFYWMNHQEAGCPNSFEIGPDGGNTWLRSPLGISWVRPFVRLRKARAEEAVSHETSD